LGSSWRIPRATAVVTGCRSRPQDGSVRGGGEGNAGTLLQQGRAVVGDDGCLQIPASGLCGRTDAGTLFPAELQHLGSTGRRRPPLALERSQALAWFGEVALQDRRRVVRRAAAFTPSFVATTSEVGRRGEIARRRQVGDPGERGGEISVGLPRVLQAAGAGGGGPSGRSAGREPEGGASEPDAVGQLRRRGPSSPIVRRVADQDSRSVADRATRHPRAWRAPRCPWRSMALRATHLAPEARVLGRDPSECVDGGQPREKQGLAVGTSDSGLTKPGRSVGGCRGRLQGRAPPPPRSSARRTA